MYTLEQLQKKNLAELKEIGWQLNVLPEGDRRRRQSWIDALVNVNPPLLQLLEVSPGVEVDRVQKPIIETVEASPAAEAEQVQEPPIESKFGRIVYPRPTQGAIAQVVETSPGVDVDRVQESIVQAGPYSPGVDVDLIESQLQEPLVESSPGACDCPFCGAQHALFTDHEYLGYPVIRCLHCAYCRPKNYLGAIRTLAQESVLESKFGRTVYPKLAAKTSPGVEVEQAQEPIIETVETSPSVGDDRVQELIAPVAKNLPGSRSKASTAHQLLELFKSSAHIIEDFPGVKTEVTVSESAIAPAVKTSFDAESDRNPILTGIPLSDKFLARYSPPQPENIRFQSEADGQLSLLNFEVVTESEPPDPDDFETLDAFREAIARWDTENSELLAASIDSMCEWVPCPEEWYWPKAEILPLKPSSTSDQLLPLQQSSVMELSIADESSITCNFFIPTFDAWCDRFNRSDEPLDTGIYARLPKSKPPSFPPTALSQARVKRGLNAYQTHTKRIPKVSRTHTHCIVVGSSTQPARSPPGGDACLV